MLKRKPHPTDHDIDSSMQGNICRCGTYQRIRQAIKMAAGVASMTTTYASLAPRFSSASFSPRERW